MANVISRNDNLPASVVEQMFNAVRGKSSLAKLAQQTPIPFNGLTEMVFTMDGEASIVGENEPKVNGGGTVTPQTVRPVKFEYGLRVSDEFLYGSEEYRLNVLKTFADGAARKFARGLDIGAIAGLNPKTKQVATAAIASNDFIDQVSNVVTYAAATPDTNIDDAIALVNAHDADVNGIAMSPTMRSALAAMKANGQKLYPEFNFGANPEKIGAMTVDVNSTLSVHATEQKEVYALLGDFNAFRWGYAKDIPLEVIQYGNPDNDAQAGDLKGHNQVYLRAEAYIGWAILDPDAFALIQAQ